MDSVIAGNAFNNFSYTYIPNIFVKCLCLLKGLISSMMRCTSVSLLMHFCDSNSTPFIDTLVKIHIVVSTYEEARMLDI